MKEVKTEFCDRCLKKFEPELAEITCPECLKRAEKLNVTDEEQELFQDATTEAERDLWFGEGSLPQFLEDFVLEYRAELNEIGV